MHQETIYDETKSNYSELAQLIYSNQHKLCSNRKINSIRDFSSHLVFVSNNIERKKLQSCILQLSQSNNIDKAKNTYDTNAIIYPQIFVIEELHAQLFVNAKSQFFNIQNQLENNSILQIAIKYFFEEDKSTQAQINYEVEFIVQKLSLLNNLLKYKSKEEIFTSHQTDLDWITQAFPSTNLTDIIFDELPNMKNQKLILALDQKVLEEKFKYIYQLIDPSEYNLLHHKLHNILSNFENFHFTSSNQAQQNSEDVFERHLHDRFTKFDFTSTRHYEETLSYLIEKDITSSGNKEKLIYIVCDDEALAKRTHSYLINHGHLKQEDIELCGYSNIYADTAVQCFIKLAKLIFGKIDVNHYVDFVTNSLLETYSLKNHFKTANMHGVRFNNHCFEDLHHNFTQQFKKNDTPNSAQNKSADVADNIPENIDTTNDSIYSFNTILSNARNKASDNTLKNNSFLSKIILLNDVFNSLVCNDKISNRNLYRFQEIAYQIKLKNCSRERFLDILQHLALSLTLKEDRDSSSHLKVKIIKSTNLSCIDYTSQANAIYLISLDINLHLGAQKHLNLSAESEYKYNSLNKLRDEIVYADNIILFHDTSNIRDGINFQLLQLNSINGDCCTLEKKINNAYLLNSKILDNKKNDNTIAKSAVDLLAEKDNDYFIKPSNLKASSIYVTALRRLFNDPQSYFVQDILKIKPVDKFNDYSYKKHFGIMCHDIINSATQNYQFAQGEKAFLECFVKDFESKVQLHLNEEHALATYARALQIGRNVVENVNFDAQNIVQEKEISHTINIDGNAINLLARVDRMENNGDNTCIIDYKTGTLPSISAIKNFEDPQMVGEAYIAYKAGFGVVDSKAVKAQSNASDHLANNRDTTPPRTIFHDADYKYFIKLIKVNATNGKACVNLDATSIIPKFEESVNELLRKYLIKDETKF